MRRIDDLLKRAAARVSTQDQGDQDPDWVYQVTYLRNLESIAEDGLLPNAGGGIGVGGYAGWSKGKTFISGPGDVSHWFSRLEDHALDRSDNPLDDGFVPVVIRFPEPDGMEVDEAAKRDARSESFFVQGGVDAEELEVWNGASWTSVSDWDSIDGSQSFDVHSDTDDETGEEKEYRDFKPDNPLLPPV